MLFFVSTRELVNAFNTVRYFRQDILEDFSTEDPQMELASRLAFAGQATQMR